MRKRAKKSTAQAAVPSGRARFRCLPASRQSLLVFIFSGHDSRVVADFVQGCGWWGQKEQDELCEEGLRDLVADIEWAFINAPMPEIVEYMWPAV